MQNDVLQPVDEKADDRLVESHDFLAGPLHGISHRIDDLNRRTRPSHDFSHRRGVGGHEVVNAGKQMRSLEIRAKLFKRHARSSRGDNHLIIGIGGLDLGKDLLFDSDILGHELDHQIGGFGGEITDGGHTIRQIGDLAGAAAAHDGLEPGVCEGRRDAFAHDTIAIDENGLDRFS